MFKQNTLVICSICVAFLVGTKIQADISPTTKLSVVLPTHNEVGYVTISEPIVPVPNEWESTNLDEQVECLALNIYHESRDQDANGQIAVGLVTINRVLSHKYPNTICDVVWQAKRSPTTKKLVPQFSWTLDGKSDDPHEHQEWDKIHRLAEGMLAERSLFNFYDFTQGSTHYHADYVTPYWSDSLDHKVTIGDHLFYRDIKALPVAFVDEHNI